MPYSSEMREEELKNKIAADYFGKFDNTKILGNIDFCIADKINPGLYYFWAEAKKGNTHDLYDSIVQLLLTIGKSRIFSKQTPPHFLGAFDSARSIFAILFSS